MRKNIIYTLLLAAALVFTACGSDSKIDPIVSDLNASLPIDPTDPTDATLPTDATIIPVDTSGMVLTAAPDTINIATAGESKAISLYLSNTNGPVANTNIKANWFDPNTGTLNSYSVATNANGQAVFNYTAPASLPASDLVITFAVENGTPAVSTPVTVTFGGSTVPPLVTTGMTLTAAPAEINIAIAKESQAISLYLSNGSVPVANTNIKANWFDPNTGTLNSYSVATNATGQAVFNYTAPASLPASDLVITFEVENGTPAVSTPVTVKFGGLTVSPIDTANLNLTAVPSVLSITASGESKVISLYLENSTTSSPQEGVSIKANFFDPNTGTLNSYSVTTNANGQAVFNYTAPEDLPAGTDFDITFDVENASASIAQTVNVVFPIQTVPQVDTTDMTLTAAPSEINIATAGESKVISLYLSDASGPVNTTNIKANWFDPNTGTLNSYSVATNANGQAVFNYIAPASLPASDLVITFTVENGTPAVSEDVTVTFGGSTVPPLDTTGMTLIAAPDTLNIATAKESQAISLYLSNGSVPVANTNIKANWFDPNTGTLNSYSVATNATGQAVFNYTAPASLPASDLVITFEVENGTPAVSTLVTVKFDHATYVLSAEQNVTVTNLNTAYMLKTTLTKQESSGVVEPAVGKIVVAEFLSLLNGSLEQYEAVVDNAGVATFNYTSPDRTLPASDVNVTFYYKDNHSIMAKTLLVFDPQSIDTVAQMYISPESFTVTAAGEVKNITIVTVNAQNVGISANIQLEQPNNGTDYGQFDMTNVTTNASGYAVVKYTAPDKLTGLAERNITVTELSQSISKELNIKFNTVSQSNTYEIVGIVPGSFAVNSVDNFGIRIVNIATGVVISPAKVYAVNLTSKFANMLLFTNNTDTTSYDSLGENNAISIRSKTLSGVAIIEVSADINDGTNDVTITASIPVTIISGPVTALTIPYVGSGPCESDQTGSLQSNKHLVHAVDKYNNPAQVRITPTLINGTKLIVPNPNYGVGTGGIDNTTNFSDTIEDFIASNVKTTDRLIITPNTDNHDYSYMGNWTIDEVINANTLTLAEKFTAAPVATGLSYIIGSEDRLLGRNVAVAHVVDPDGGYETDGNGTLLLEVCFDPKLAGHTFTLGAYAQDNNRTGIATIEAFRWSEFTSEVVDIDNDGSVQTIYLNLGIGGDILEPLVDVDISPSSIIVEKKPHCVVDNILSDFHTDAAGKVKIILNTDGNTSVTGGVDTCTVEWDAKTGSIQYEY